MKNLKEAYSILMDLKVKTDKLVRMTEKFTYGDICNEAGDYYDIAGKGYIWMMHWYKVLLEKAYSDIYEEEKVINVDICSEPLEFYMGDGLNPTEHLTWDILSEFGTELSNEYFEQVDEIGGDDFWKKLRKIMEADNIEDRPIKEFSSDYLTDYYMEVRDYEGDEDIKDALYEKVSDYIESLKDISDNLDVGSAFSLIANTNDFSLNVSGLSDKDRIEKVRKVYGNETEEANILIHYIDDWRQKTLNTIRYYGPLEPFSQDKYDIVFVYAEDSELYDGYYNYEDGWVSLHLFNATLALKVLYDLITEKELEEIENE